MQHRKCIFVYVICFIMIVFMQIIHIPCSLSAPQYAIKFATVAPEGTIWVQYMRALDEDIRKKSDGRMGFLIYPGGVAGDELDVLRKIRIGQIHCTAFTGVGFGQILPMVRVLDLPFLFHTDEAIDSVHREMYSLFADAFRKKGFELLAWAEVGNAHLLSKKPVRSLKDLSGLKVWTWSGDPIAKETFSEMGVNPIPLAITDVTTALNRGMIDTVYATPLGALALQWHSQVNYMTALPIVHSTGAILISSKYFNKLPKDLSEILTSGFKKTMADLNLELRKQNQETFKLIQYSGVNIIPMPSGAELAEFYKIHDAVAQKLSGKVYSQEILEKVYTILKRSN